jgi:hypothetical protein
MSSLREAVRHALPANVVALMDELEAFAGDSIGIVRDPSPPPAGVYNRNAPGAMVSHLGAEIRLPDPDVWQPREILHELLHIQRYWLEGVPQFVRKGPNASAHLASEVENQIEHLVIVPREVTYGFAPDDSYWNASAQHNWSSYPWPSTKDKVLRRRHSLLLWLAMARVTDESVRSHAVSCLEAEGLLTDARALEGAMRAAIRNKKKAIACIVRFLALPRADFRVATFDIKNKQVRLDKIPLFFG